VDVRPGARNIIAWGLTALISVYAVGGSHDYMSWNRARYALLAELEGDGVGARQIDGGMEYNAWHLAAELGTWPTRADVIPGAHTERKSWWWVVDDRFVVSLRPLAGFTVRARRDYPTWLGSGPGSVFLLERVGEG
jgi:hypothetical protein